MAKKKKDIPNYGKVTHNGIEYYRTRVTDADGKRVETVTGLQAGDTLTVRLPDGRVEAEIREVYQENLPG